MAIELNLDKEIKLDLSKGSGLTLDLQKGNFVNLSKNSLDKVKLRAGAGWNCKQVKTSGFFGFGGTTSFLDIDLDLAVGMRDEYGELLYKVYFGNKTAPGVHLDKDDLTGTQGYIDIDQMCTSTKKDNENTTIDLSKVPKDVAQIEIGVCIYNNFVFSDIDNAYCKLVDETNNRVLCSVKMQNDGGRNKTVHMATLKRTTEGWVFESVKQYKEGKIGDFLR